jgi:hypothetical protein
MVCMAVSRFLAKHTKNNFSEKEFFGVGPDSRVFDPNGSGGYMRRGRRAATASWCLLLGGCFWAQAL